VAFDAAGESVHASLCRRDSITRDPRRRRRHLLASKRRIRLVGFDAPELGEHAHCGLERMLAARATSRLRQMIQLSTDIDLQIVDCACRPGTQGTMACNYGRACGYLTVDGQDVSDTLIAENLAHPLVWLEVLMSATAVVVSAGAGRRPQLEEVNCND
jgi:endonuclease YncB( thermonuclease family)